MQVEPSEVSTALQSPSSSSSDSADEEVLSLGDGVTMSPVHDEVRDDIICAIFNLPKSTVFYQDFSCAFVSTIVYHGRMYPAGDQVCFYSNLFGKETKLLIPYTSITELSKTSNMFSHGLRIQTSQKEYSFTSFWSNNRDHCAAIIETLRHKSIGGFTSPQNTAAISPESFIPTPLASPPSTASIVSTSTTTEVVVQEKEKIPDKHPFQDMAHEVFALSLDEFLTLYINDNAAFGLDEVNRRRGATDIECSSWVEESDVWTRTASFTQPVDAPIGPKSTRVNIIQTRYSDGDSTYIIETSTKLADIPYGDCFKVDDRFLLTKLSDSSWDLVIQLRVVFSKSTMWRGFIESRAKSECKQKSLEWIQLAKLAMTSEGLPPLPHDTKGIQSPRQKKPKVNKPTSSAKEESKKSQPSAATPSTPAIEVKKRTSMENRRLASIIIPWAVILLLGYFVYCIYHELLALHATLRQVQERFDQVETLLAELTTASKSNSRSCSSN